MKREEQLSFAAVWFDRFARSTKRGVLDGDGWDRSLEAIVRIRCTVLSDRRKRAAAPKQVEIRPTGQYPDFVGRNEL
ncbi:MAG: hypothetical protein ACXWNJ_17455 [Vulcanimicrobiaceae bacterium]